eukprot:131443-Rhodomonas_salina.1
MMRFCRAWSAHVSTVLSRPYRALCVRLACSTCVVRRQRFATRVRGRVGGATAGAVGGRGARVFSRPPRGYGSHRRKAQEQTKRTPRPTPPPCAKRYANAECLCRRRVLFLTDWRHGAAGSGAELGAREVGRGHCDGVSSSRSPIRAPHARS